MSRPREFEESEVLERAMSAFWRYGYQGTGIQDLVRETGINRASLYGAFGNKHRLFLTVLERYSDLCLNGLRTSLRSEPHPVRGVRRMLDDFMENIHRSNRGCLLYNTALEICAYDEEIRRRVKDGMERIEELLVDHLRRAQEDGHLEADLNPLVLARTVMAAMQSMTVRASAGAASEVMESLRDGAMLIFTRKAG